MPDRDPSLARDVEAKTIATTRSDESDTKLGALSAMFHSMKSELSANTAFTKMVDGKVDAMAGKQTDIIAKMNGICTKVEAIDTDALKETAEIIKSLKGVGKAASWIGAIAKWVTTLAAAIGVLWAIFHYGPPK